MKIKIGQILKKVKDKKTKRKLMIILYTYPWKLPFLPLVDGKRISYPHHVRKRHYVFWSGELSSYYHLFYTKTGKLPIRIIKTRATWDVMKDNEREVIYETGRD